MASESELLTFIDSGIQTVIPTLATPSPQVVYLDFDGAETSYYNHDLDIFIDNITVDDSGFDSTNISYIVAALNEQFDDNIVFTTELPQTNEYSTIYIGVTSAFDMYGEFLGLAETVDSGNQIHDDNAFVFLNSTASTELVTSVIAHEARHLVGTVEHEGEGIDKYAAIGSVISSGETRTGLTIDKRIGYLTIESGGTAISTTLNSNSIMFISNGGMAISTIVNFGAKVSCHGTALAIKENGGYVLGANVTFLTNTFSGLVIDGGAATVHSGTTAINITVTNGSMHVFSGGTAFAIKENGGEVVVDEGATVSFVPNTISGLSRGGFDVNAIYGPITLHSGTTAFSITLDSMGFLDVYSKGIASNTIVNAGGHLNVGGTTVSTTVNSRGSMLIGHGGIAISTTILFGGNLDIVSSGGTAISTTIFSGGHMVVASGGTANNITIVSGGGLRMAVAPNTYIQGTSSGSAFEMKNAFISGYSGRMIVYSGGTATCNTVDNNVAIVVYSGGTVNSTTVNSGGTLQMVYGGGTVISTTVNSGGRLIVESGIGGTIIHTIVNSGGSLIVGSGGKIKGSLTIASGGIVRALSGSIINFDISSNFTSNSNYLVNNLSLISDAPSYTITVSSSQAVGNYKLATGASSFTGSITVWDTSNTKYGTLTVGQTITKNNTNYTLLRDNSGNLSLQIQADDVIAPTISSVSLAQGASDYTFTATVSATDNVTATANLTYKIRYASTSAGVSSATATSGKSFTLAAANAAKTYYYQVGVTDEAGNTAWSTAKSFTVKDVTAPTISSATLAQGSNDYKFTATVSATDNVTAAANLAYKIRYATTSAGLSSATAASGKSFTLAASNAGKTYYWQVGVTDEAEKTSWSAAKSFTVKDVTAPTISSATLSQGANDYKFTATVSATDNVTAAANLTYRIRYATTSAGLSSATAASGKSFTLAASDAGKTYYWQVGVTDAAGNTAWSASKSFIVNGITPLTISITCNPTTWTKNNVTLTANFSGSGIKSQQYSFDNSTWQNYTSALTISENKTVYFKAVNSAGNSVSSSYSVTNIDKVAPTIKNIGQNITTPTNSNVIVSAAFADDKALKSQQYRISSGGSWLAYSSGGVTMTSNGTVYFRAIDSAGNSATTSHEVTNIDKVAPTIKNIGQNITTPTNSNVIVSAAFADDKALKSQQYRIVSGGSWLTYSSGGVTMTSNGTVYFRAIDSAGNSATTSHSVTNIDKVPPTITNIGATLAGGSAIVSATFADDKALKTKQYRIGSSGSWLTYSSGGVTMSSNGTVHFRAIDSAGNSTTSSYSVTIPSDVSIVVKANTTAPTNQNVTVTATFGSSAKTKQYRIGSSGSWLTYSSGGVTMSSNGTVYFKAIDSAGNSTTSSYNVTNIDKVPPTIKNIGQNVTTPTNGNVIVSAAFADDKALKSQQYRINSGGSWLAYSSGGVTMTSNGTVYFQAIDSAGNSTSSSYNVTNIDKVAPTITNVGQNVTTPTNGNVIVSATFADDKALKSQQYRIGSGGSWLAYSSGGVTMTSNGTVYFQAIDSAGNSATTSKSVTNIDKVPPAKPTAKASTTAQTNQSVTVTATFSSDTATKQYSLDNKVWKTYTQGIVMSSNGTVYFRGIDAAGNVSDVTSYKVTNIVTVVEPPTAKANTTAPTNQNVTVTATFGSSTVTKQYSLDNKDWKNYTQGIVMSSNGTVYFRGIDAAGNVSAVTSYSVTNIDKVKPSISITGNPTAWTKNNVTLTASFSDSESGVNSQQYSFDNSTWQNYTSALTISENKTVYFKAIDNAGNEKVESVSVNKIDKVKPSISITGNPNVWTKNNVTLTASFSDSGSGVKSKQYSLDNSTWQTYTSALTISENKTVYFKAIDNAENEKVESVSVNKIDKIAPTLSGTPTITVDGSNAKITWSAAKDNVGVTGYNITVDGNLYASLPVTNTTLTSISYTLKNLANGTHAYSISAYDAAGNESSKSPSQSFTIGVTPPIDEDKPPVITSGPTHQQGEKNYTFTVTVTATDDKTAAANLTYTIRYATTVSGLSSATIKSGKSFTLSASDACKTYYYQVGVSDGVNLPTWSDPTEVKVKDVTAPTIPGAPIATVNGQSVTISWDKTAAWDNVGVTGYQIKIGDKTYTTKGTTTSYTVSNLATGNYTYQIRAYDAAGNMTSYTPAQAFTIKATAPSTQKNYSEFKWSGNNEYAFVSLPGLTKGDFTQYPNPAPVNNDDGQQYYWYTNKNNIVDAEKGSLTIDDYYLYKNTCWAATASNMFKLSGWSEGVFSTEDITLKYICDNFTKIPVDEGYKGVSGGNAFMGCDWLLNGYDTYYASNWREFSNGGYSVPSTENAGGFYKNKTGYKTDDYLSFLDADYDGFQDAMEQLKNGYSIGLGVDWDWFYNGKIYVPPPDYQSGHAITVYGFTYDESKKGTPQYFTGIIVADSDDDKGYAKTPNGYSADQSPNRVKVLDLVYLKVPIVTAQGETEQEVYVFNSYGFGQLDEELYQVGVLSDLQSLAPRPENYTCSLSSNIDFSKNPGWNASYFVGTSAEAALAGDRDARITTADDVYVALSLVNLGLGTTDCITLTAVIDGDKENALEFTAIKPLGYEESDSGTVINLGKFSSGTHHIELTVSADEISNSLTIDRLYVTYNNNNIREFSVVSGDGVNGLELLAGDLMTVEESGTATGCIVTANSEQFVKADGLAVGSKIYANGMLTVEVDGTANESEIFNSGFIVVNGNAQGSIIHAGGVLLADQYSEVKDTKIEADGWMDINYQGSATDTDVYGNLFVTNGIAENTTVYAGGEFFVQDTGRATITVVQNTGKQFVSSGGSAFSNTLTGINSEQYIFDSGSTATDNLLDGASQIVSDGGIVTGNTLVNNAIQDLSNGAYAIDTELSGESWQYILNATAVNTVINAGCHSLVFKGGLAISSVVKEGGYLNVGDFDGKLGQGVGAVRDLSVEYGGFAMLEDGAKLFGTNIIAGQLDLSGKVAGAISGIEDASPYIIFDLSDHTVSDDYVISDISLCTNLNFSITLSETQSFGKYKLSANAINSFDGQFSIYDNNGVFYGVMDSETLVVMGDRLVSLENSGTSLYVLVTSSPYASYEIPDTLVKTSDNRGTWGHVVGNDDYIVQFSRDGFETYIMLKTDTESVSMNNLPYDLEWRIRSVNSTVWTNGGMLLANSDAEYSLVSADKNWDYDLLFAQSSEQWLENYVAKHLGEIDSWDGTGETVALGGKNKLSNIFEASSDANILLLTDDANGDTLFVDDVFSFFPDGVRAQSRIAKIDEIRAGAGDDVVDLTSQRFSYVGDGLTVRGGLGDDVIWANKGDNLLFGDAGNDRIVGASGNDVLIGGAGDDSMHGGGGEDIFAFGGDWGNDVIQQFATGEVTLWFDHGDLSKWDADALTYTDGNKSVAVSGVLADKISLKFGDDGSTQYQDLLAMGAFAEATSEKIFEDRNKGMLA